MSDRDDLGQAWHVAPSRYLEQRRASHAVGAPSSCYVAMPDGVRLAVDVYLPEGADRPERLPVIAVFTPYYRRFKVTAPGAEPSPNVAIYRDFFVARGYALVVVDVRGCGASFGARDCFRSPANAKTIARSPTGSSRSPGRAVRSVPQASRTSVPPPASWRAPAIPL